jgi:ABC-type glycerol-3-phosphate transport system substrate-binding protein
MSIRKILFLAIAWIAILILAITIIILSQKEEKVSTAPKELKVWIHEWATEDYDTIIKWFKEYAPEFASTNIIFEKKTTDPIRYRTLLLSMMSDSMSPDIFMVGAGEDAILRSRIEPIPEEYIDIRYFEREYDDIFLPLIVSTGSKELIKRSLLWVPLWFETMGIFYNKNLIREVPNTWDELDILHQQWIIDEVFVSNLWLWPRYTQNASDVMSLFLVLDGLKSITNTTNIVKNSIWKYLSYRDATSTSADSENNDIYNPNKTLEWEKTSLETTKTTTLDMFVEWKIGMIFGFPSIVLELEKSDKRIGSAKSTAWVILTSKIPSKDRRQWRENIARYNYFAVAKGSKNPGASAQFLQYLMTTDAQRKFLEKNPHLIAAQRSLWTAQKNTQLSSILNRASIDVFIPDIDESLSVFDYWLKAEFNQFLSDYIDRNNFIDNNNILNAISHKIGCTLVPYDSNIKSTQDCEKM